MRFIHTSANFLRGLFFIVVFSSVCWKQEPEPLVSFRKEIERLAASSSLVNGYFAFSLLDGTGKPLIEYNANKLLMPASNLKLVTTAAALHMLGPEFVFETTLGYSGVIRNGVLEGDVVILGGGDPTLGSNRFAGYPDYDKLMNLWLEETRKLGIERINGDIVADPGRFSANMLPDGWIWTDIGNYYGAGSGGINIHENYYKLYFKPGKPGDQATVSRVAPEIPDLKFINEMKTGTVGSGDNGYIYGGPYSSIRYLRGTIPAGVKEFSIKGSIPDPAYFAAYSLKRKLMDHHVLVSGEAINLDLMDKGRESYIGNLIPIFRVASPPLKDIVKETNYHSINLYAEALLNMIGYRFRKEGGTETGIEVLNEWLIKSGYKSSGDQRGIVDGSGLSLANTVSAGFLARLLYQSKADTFFVGSLPIAGVHGTMRGFARNTKAHGRIMAKSGSFNNVIGYSGYIRRNNGELLSFSLLINNYEGGYSQIRTEIEKILIKAVEL